MSDRPVIIGMNNPHSERPDSALLPYPRGVAGWRLWRMTHEVCGVSRHEYCRLTDRRNLVNARTWDPVAAREGVEDLWRTLEGRRVLVLGATVRSVLWLLDGPPLRWHSISGVDWCLVPHPSGLNRWYNDELNRVAVGMLLEEELVRAGMAA